MPAHLIVLRGVLLLATSIAVTCVLNGYQAAQGQFPFLVLLRINQGRSDSYICGGALVAPRYVVTAGHCSFGDTTDVVVGQNNIATIQPGNVFGVVSKKRPANYGVHYNSNDIAIFTLDRDVPYVNGVTEYLKIGVDQLQVGDTGVMVGYGQTSLNTLPDSAHYKEIQISKDSDCNLLHDYYSPYMYCVVKPGVQACFGDSGIPVIQQDSSNRPVLVGMLSYGSARYCGASDAQQTLAKLSVMIEFIRENTPLGGLSFVETPSRQVPATTTTKLPTTTKAPTTTTTTKAPTTQRPTTTTTTKAPTTSTKGPTTTLRPTSTTEAPKTTTRSPTSTTKTPASTAKTTTTLTPVSSSLAPSTSSDPSTTANVVTTTNYPISTEKQITTPVPTVTTQPDRVGFGNLPSSASITTYSKLIVLIALLLLFL